MVGLMGEPLKITSVTRMNTDGIADTASATRPFFMRLTGASLTIQSRIVRRQVPVAVYRSNREGFQLFVTLAGAIQQRSAIQNTHATAFKQDDTLVLKFFQD